MLVWTEAVASSFCGFQQSYSFSLVPLNRTPRTPLPHLSLCAVVISDQPKQIHFYIFIYKMGEKNDPGNFYGTLTTSWFILFFIFIFSKPDATEQVLQFITEISLCQLFLGSYKRWNCPVCQQSVSLAPLLKSLTLSKPLQVARNNTYCFIPVKCCKYFTLCCVDEARTAGKKCLNLENSFTRIRAQTGEKLR